MGFFFLVVVIMGRLDQPATGTAKKRQHAVCGDSPIVNETDFQFIFWSDVSRPVTTY
jgi:hypothetical protein